MEKRFEAKRIFVTGGGSGIGQATVTRLLYEGGWVIAADISQKGLQETIKIATELGVAQHLRTLEIDLSNELEIEQKLGSEIESIGGLDVVVNAAGILRAAHFHETTLELWNTLIKTNLTSTFLVTQKALPALLQSGKGVIINFSSTAANFAHPYFAAYAATKGGIQALTHAIAAEYASKGLRAVSIVPGGIQTGMTNEGSLKFPDGIDTSLFSKQVAALPGGLGSPHAVAAAIAMLASEDGRFITGTELRIDGGAHM
ncbi:NAD(P)-dependent dehydrogenase, short-chain alcohol dehydrogenase family [Chitinophaga costaii]|uniref:NAD(P)-dependent dehydrogenase, short-chain alcohol dehydrogenase family n=1 Tax=Chitinophaga costaii TaxID=1335309 RepID=A0A1C3YSN1_9BACT|nr:SDR family oxidoreductase [Chitinophaga costaii]PUZ30087.1 SDR family NAD(P)-dependent oxidoreductase [Chitinophaga costaii]SCB73107.1 NAD(P)-dependent dehydrogenase, short-chain alcohol dehydrogenase family [Chitinophaga costaii]